ncbi:MAG: hypothetical protein AAGJ81_14605 [Verrucomicrobiota bacterium]
MNREQEAWDELERSSVSKASRWFLVCFFLLSLFAIFGFDLWKTYGPRDAVLVFTERSRPILEDASMGKKVLDWNDEVLADIGSFEDQIADESILRKTVPAYQWLFLEVLHTSGTGRVLLGNGNWYFLKEGVESSLGWGIPGELREADWAVRRVAGRLAELDIQLVLLPIPGKASIQPAQFSNRFERAETVPTLPDYDEVYKAWDQLPGVSVVRADQILAARTNRGEVSFLERDTHWNPEGLHAVLERLVSEVPKNSPNGGDFAADEFSGEGDLTRMMDLPADTVPRERVQRTVVQDERQWTTEAEVYFLGDSFAAIYSDEALGWGENAGLKDQLPVRLDEPVEFFINYGDPVGDPTRQLERRLDQISLEQAPRVVIWQFAERFLSQGAWANVFRSKPD